MFFFSTRWYFKILKSTGESKLCILPILLRVHRFAETQSRNLLGASPYVTLSIQTNFASFATTSLSPVKKISVWDNEMLTEGGGFNSRLLILPHSSPSSLWLQNDLTGPDFTKHKQKMRIKNSNFTPKQWTFEFISYFNLKDHNNTD